MIKASRVIRSPRGPGLNARNWQCEAALRLLMNNLDPDVAERPEALVVYGGIGKAARNWACFDRICEVLTTMGEAETLLVQSGKPVGVFKTHARAPRVLIANANLVPKWANWEHFNELDRMGLMMYGQMTAGSWIYIGSQGIVQGTYETFAEIGRQHFAGDLSGRWILTAGLGGMGGAQPKAATMAGASMLVVECDRARAEFRLRSGYLDCLIDDVDEALTRLRRALASGDALAVGVIGNCVDIYAKLLEIGFIPDVVTDQTAAHDPSHGFLPRGWSLETWREQQRLDPAGVAKQAKDSMAEYVGYMLSMQSAGAIAVEYGNNLRAMAKSAGEARAFDFPGFVQAYVRPLFCRGRGPFRWVALSGDPEDIYRTDAKVLELIPDDPSLSTWLKKARASIQFQGLPARICWLGLGERHRIGLAFNEMVAKGELSAPVVIGRDHMDSGSVASPHRETEGMLDGSDAVSDWPLLNVMLNSACGPTWASFHHGGGMGMGYSQHSGIAIVADGSSRAADALRTILWNDPATGVMRHADAGYESARACAKAHGLWLPMDSAGDIESDVYVQKRL